MGSGIVVSSREAEKMASSAFCQRMTRLIAEIDPDAKGEIDTAEGAAILTEQLDRAGSYGLVSELDAGRYVIAAWLLGRDFDTEMPAAAALLTDPAMTGRRRGEALERLVRETFDTHAG